MPSGEKLTKHLRVEQEIFDKIWENWAISMKYNAEKVT